MIEENTPIEAKTIDGVASAELSIGDHDPDFFKTLTELVRQKRLIAKIVGVAALTGVVLSLALPVRYTATIKIMTPQQTPSSASMIMMNQLANSGVSALAASAGGGLGLRNPNDLYIGILTSRSVSDAIINGFGLDKIYDSKDMTAARKELDKNTHVVSEKSGLIAISVTDKDRKRAADIANAYTEQLRALTRTLAMSEASQRRVFYEQELNRAKEDLLAAEFSFQQVQQKRGLIQLDAQAKALIESQAALHAQVAAKQVQVQSLRSYSTEHNPEVQIAENQLASLQGEAARLERRQSTSGSSDIGMADVPSAGLEYLRAAHELQYRQALYDLLIKQYDAARMDESKEAAIIQIVEPAIEPDRKSSPQRALIILWSTLIGLIGGCAYVLFSNFVRKRPDVLLSIAELRAAVWQRETIRL